MSRVELEGRGLFGGGICRVVLTRTELDHVRVSAGGSPLVHAADLRVVSTERTTTVGHGAMKLALVEHLFAALAGMNVRAGLDIEVAGEELPLLDGGAATWCAALGELKVNARQDVDWLMKNAARLSVDRTANVEVGDSVYRFTTTRGSHVRVEIDFDDPRLTASADWTDGGADDFVHRIAPARTFMRFADTDAVLAAGLSVEVDPRSVVVLAGDAIHAAGRPFVPDEPARHKLLDLLGDLYLHGGPPMGTIEAYRPGHAATHRAVEEALARGILGPQPK